MKTPFKLLAAALLLAAATPHAKADETPKPPPDRREIFVPIRDLETVLASHPRAVLLSREQYETLLRDAKKILAPAPEPPQRAVLAAAHYIAELNGDVADVQAEFTVNVLSEKWAEVPLRMGSLALGNISLDGDAAVAASADAARLLIRGRGEHKITATFMLPVRRDSGVNSLQLSLPRAAAGFFTINLPPGADVESSLPVDVKKSAAATTATLATGRQNDLLLTWRVTGGSQTGEAVLFQESSYIYSIDETKVQADLGIVLNAALGNLPQTLRIKIPSGSTPLQVQGGEVQKWSVDGDSLTVDLVSGERKATGFRVLLETPSLGQKSKETLSLPLPEVAGVRRAAGKIAVLGSSGVKVKEISAGDGAVQTEGIFDSGIEQDAGFVAAYGFATQPASLKVSVEKITPRFSADLDTFVELKREAIFVERTLALNGDDGEFFAAELEMPATEELVSVRCEDGSEPDWKADGAKIKIRWSDGVGAGKTRVFKIKSRIEPPKWPETDAFSLGDLKVVGAEKINGYIAVKADEMFRVETSATEGLERRDGRTTPVRGDFAWFRRDEFKLDLRLARRAPEVQSALLGYALPMDGALDVHGQINFNILYSVMKKLRVKVPAESAEQFYFDGEQIAERNRDGDTWTILLQKEISGNYSLKFHAVIPFKMEQANFQVDVPSVEPLDVKQQTGTWAVEANTATEINFKSSGMNELDPQRAPVLADYQPQHHVIGVFAYLGQQHSLKLEGVKHETAPILTAVADRLELDTVVSTSGAQRHQALFYIRTLGDQFLDVTLPSSSSLWSLTVDDEPLKPVAEKQNVVRVQLPATLDRTRATRVQLLYETRSREWGASGGYSLVAPRLAARIPVLQSAWRVWLPDGFSYTAFDSNLRKTEQEKAEPLIFLPCRWLENINPFFVSYAAVRRAAPIPASAPVSASGEMSRQVSRLLAEADVFYNSARYDLAFKRCEQILGIDPYNIAARRMQEKIDAARDHYANEAYDETRSHLIWPVTKGWELPPRKYQGREDPESEMQTSAVRSREYVQGKLNRIIIPKIEFREATVREAIDYLMQKARELDTQEPDPSKRGVNIVLKLEGQGEQANSSPNEAKITLSLTNIPLSEALRYITSLAGLKVKIDQYAVTVVPLSEAGDTLITKEYTVPPGFLSTPSAATADATGAGANIVTKQTALDYLTAQGMVFPPGASANFVPNSNKLIVRNTEANLDLMDTIVEPLAANTPASPDAPASETLGSVNNTSPIQPQKAAGLLPMKLDLERAGREFSFEGLQAAESVNFHYTDWWSQARRGWIWWVAGGVAFFSFMQFGAWRRLVWGILVLTFVPLCIAQSLTGMCNALLAGWLTGFLIYQIATRLVFRRRVVEVATT